jgi:hypothetical protein
MSTFELEVGGILFDDFQRIALIKTTNYHKNIVNSDRIFIRPLKTGSIMVWRYPSGSPAGRPDSFRSFSQSWYGDICYTDVS